MLNRRDRQSEILQNLMNKFVDSNLLTSIASPIVDVDKKVDLVGMSARVASREAGITATRPRFDLTRALSRLQKVEKPGSPLWTARPGSLHQGALA